MEIEAEDGSNILTIKCGSYTDFGRRLGFPLFDRAVSRKHISFALAESNNPCLQDSESRVDFQVTGKNPVWVFSCESNDVRIFRNKEKGKMSSGDCFCVSARHPVLFRLSKSRVEGEEVEEKKGLMETERRERVLEGKEMEESIRSSDEDVLLGLGSIDVSGFNPAKEFGFVIMGCEFDNYPKGSIRDIRDWNWFLEEPKDDDSDNDEVNERNGTGRKKNMKRKKKVEGDIDQDWAGESDTDKVLIAKQRRGKRPKYATRSKDLKKPIEDYDNEDAKEDYDDDEDEETLGGFIVDNQVLEEEPVDTEEEEEEEEEDDDDVDSDDEQISEG